MVILLNALNLVEDVDKVILYPPIFLFYVLKFLGRNNKNIKGIEIYGNDFKISQFADDTTLLLDWCEQTLIYGNTAIFYKYFRSKSKH